MPRMRRQAKREWEWEYRREWERRTEEEKVRWGVRGCTCPPGWDNDDGELFGILWAVSMGY